MSVDGDPFDRLLADVREQAAADEIHELAKAEVATTLVDFGEDCSWIAATAEQAMADIGSGSSLTFQKSVALTIIAHEMTTQRSMKQKDTFNMDRATRRKQELQAMVLIEGFSQAWFSAINICLDGESLENPDISDQVVLQEEARLYEDIAEDEIRVAAMEVHISSELCRFLDLPLDTYLHGVDKASKFMINYLALRLDSWYCVYGQGKKPDATYIANAEEDIRLALVKFDLDAPEWLSAFISKVLIV